MHNIVNEIMKFAVYLIDILGYPGILIAGALEFLGLPVSGEILIPLIGIMVAKSHLNIILALIFLTVGSVLGTLVLYSIGYYFSNWAESFTKQKLIKYTDKIDTLNHWIRNHSSSVNFFTRFLPFLRVYISLFAGIERIPPVPFILFSTLGIGIWNAIFLLGGYYLGDNLNLIFDFIKREPYLTSMFCILIIIISVIIFLLYKRRKTKLI